MTVRRGDVALVVAAGLLAAAGSFAGSTQLPQPAFKTQRCVDVWFESDIPYVYASMISAQDHHHRRTNRHPLFSLASYPPVRALRLAFPTDALTAVRLTIALVAAAWAVALALLLRSLGLTLPQAAAMTGVGLFSAAAVFWLPVPETWVFGSVTILWALLIVARDGRQRLSSAWHVAAAVLTFSMTTTNGLTGAAFLALRHPWRRAIALLVASAAIVLGLWSVQKLLFHNVDLIPSKRQVGRFFIEPESWFVDRIASVYFVNSVVMPQPALVSRMTRPGNRLTAQRSLWHAPSPGFALIAAAWLALLALGVWGAWRQRRDLFVRVLALSIAGHFVLHVVYGASETFLYALHYGPLLVLLASFAFRTPARRAALVLAAVLVPVLAVYNVGRFRDAVRMAHAQPYINEITVPPHEQ